ncbi:hypothetical protein [Actinomadura atramentaria]|nr:hypothetical protein [Actinomadura atramentaria]
MRIAIAAVAGVLLAALASFGAVQLASASQDKPVVQSLYQYGDR